MDSIIFDVDGTLWDSTIQVTESWNLAIQENASFHLVLEPVSLSRVFGKTMTEIADTIFHFLSPEEREKMIRICFDYENRYLENHPGILYPGVAHTIKRLAKSYPLFIVSNCQRGYIEVLLRTTGLNPYITDHLCFGDTNTEKGKTIRTLMKRNNLKNPVYVGDTQGDADACKDAGIPFIYAGYGLGNVPDANIKISRFSDLVQLISDQTI